ncbi:MAG: hypothetical protein PUH25_09145, partial [Spirochaetales bacterium]|nr:hypothetical protein [Spirochaetales bacterium]
QGSSYTYSGTDKNVFTINGGTINRKNNYNLYISSGSKIPTVVNIKAGIDFKCNTVDGITVNKDYTE